MSVCGIDDPGSIPGESTKIKSPFVDFLFLGSHQLQDFDEKTVARIEEVANYFLR